MKTAKRSPVVVGSSLAEGSDEVVARALALARASHLPLTVVHAFEPASPAFAPFPTAEVVADPRWMDRLSEALTSRLEDQGRRLGIGAADGETRLILDTAERALTTCAADTRAALIVVGESTRARALRLLGTTADRLVRRSPCPVLVTHPGSAFPPRTVLIPVDLSDLSGGALRAGLSMIRQAGWTPEWVEVLFALDPAERTGSLQFSPEQVERFAADELERFLANYGDAAGVNLRRHVLTAEPREGLLERIAELGPDLVVVGTHGRRGLDRLLLGSVATAVLAHAETNVLVVPPEAASAHLASSQEGPDWQYVSDENHSTAA